MGSSEHDKAPKVLICLCGECAHWEIVEASPIGIDITQMDPMPINLRCMTCKKEFEASITVPPSDHLAWAPQKDVKVA